MSVVLDASITLAWVYPEERTDPVLEVFALVVRSEAYVPAIWHLEVANGLELAARRGRIAQGFRDTSLADLSILRIGVDTETAIRAWSDCLQIASRHRLTLYDACYLELAKRRGLPLATLDRDLRAAATAKGVTLLGI